jgi:hypothetical protein
MSKRISLTESGFSLVTIVVTVGVVGLGIFAGYAISERAHNLQTARKDTTLRETRALRLTQLLVQQIDCKWIVDKKISSFDSAYWTDIMSVPVKSAKFIPATALDPGCACFHGSVAFEFEDVALPVSFPLHYAMDDKMQLLACSSALDFMTSENGQAFMGTKTEFTNEDGRGGAPRAPVH